MLRSNANVELPSQMIFVDTETRGAIVEPGVERHRLWFGCALYRRTRESRGKMHTTEEWFTFTTPNEFWDWVEDKALFGRKLYIFAHNWNFDGSILYTATQLHDRGWQTMGYVNENPPFILRVKRDRHYLALIDTLNYFTMSLAALGESIGIPKLPFPDYAEDWETWVTYCKRDVQVLCDAVIQYINFIDTEDLGNFRPTIASQAFNAFRHRFMTVPIMIHDNRRALELERDSYFGGRVECFRIGEVTEPLYYLDVNSMYPFVMRDHEYPTAIYSLKRRTDVERLKDALTAFAVTAKVLINTDEPVYPFVRNDKLMFPIGEFCVTLSTPELLYALERGHIVHVYEMALYKRAKIFTEYVESLYAARQRYRAAGNPAFAFMCKIMLNSLYGKFGQRSHAWDDVRAATEDDPPEWLQQFSPGDPVARYRVRMGRVQMKTRPDESRDSFPAIAAHVTAYGRMLLWELIKQAGRENVFYCDTDSLVVNTDGFNRLKYRIDDKRLGCLKLEDTATTAEFNCPKDYRFGDTVRMKGIRRDAVEIEPATFKQQQFRSWDYHMSQGDEGFIDIQTIRKHLNRIYGKGSVGDDGKVTPYHFRVVTEDDSPAPESV